MGFVLGVVFGFLLFDGVPAGAAGFEAGAEAEAEGAAEDGVEDGESFADFPFSFVGDGEDWRGRGGAVGAATRGVVAPAGVGAARGAALLRGAVRRDVLGVHPVAAAAVTADPVVVEAGHHARGHRHRADGDRGGDAEQTGADRSGRPLPAAPAPSAGRRGAGGRVPVPGEGDGAAGLGALALRVVREQVGVAPGAGLGVGLGVQIGGDAHRGRLARVRGERIAAPSRRTVRLVAFRGAAGGGASVASHVLAFLVLVLAPGVPSRSVVLKINTELTRSSEFQVSFIGSGRYRMAPGGEVSRETMTG
ncbi:hypothetical protein RKD42_006016 [Streptomyces ambofaciens]